MKPSRPLTWKGLGFTPQPPVKWFSPSTLARSAVKVILSATFGEYLDKREIQRSLPDQSLSLCKDRDEIWFDFVADTADGFDPTYTVAYAVSQLNLRVQLPAEDGSPPEILTLPRGDLLVFGGDQVYPYAAAREYDERFRGPYKAALPWTDAARGGTNRGHPHVLAIPGNHDWYDGLTGFMRVFAQPGWIGGRRRLQTRSYFAVDLPGPFWLWGIDIGSDAFVDAAQTEYFTAAAEQMNMDDQLILCTAKPSWADLVDEPDAYRNLAFVERELVPPRVRTMLMLSGDQHHYARYEAAKDGELGKTRMKITSGGGGAFLSATHKLDQTIDVPTITPPGETPVSARELPTEPFELRGSYPSKPTSRLLSARIFLLGLRSPSFLTIPAAIYVLLYLAGIAGARSDFLTVFADAPTEREKAPPGYVDLVTGGLSPAMFILFATLWVLCAGFCTLPKRIRGTKAAIYRSAAGLAHALCHAALVGLVAMAVVSLIGGFTPLWAIYACAAAVGLFGAAIGSLVFATFLWLVFTSFGWNTTEAFSSFRCEDYKNFLRIRVTKEEVAVYPIGIEKVCHAWTFPKNVVDPEVSWVQPRQPIAAHLIEGPLRFRCVAPAPRARSHLDA